MFCVNFVIHGQLVSLYNMLIELYVYLNEIKKRRGRGIGAEGDNSSAFSVY